MSGSGHLRFRLERGLGRFTTTAAAVLTLGRMPPFVSASCLVEQDGRVLMVQDPIRQEAVLPGGHLHWRETPESGAAREVFEETGYRVEVGELLGVFGGEENTGEPGIVRVLYGGTVRGGALRASAEGPPVWLSVDEIPGDTRDGRIVHDVLSRRGATGRSTPSAPPAVGFP